MVRDRCFQAIVCSLHLTHLMSRKDSTIVENSNLYFRFSIRDNGESGDKHGQKDRKYAKGHTLVLAKLNALQL
jgi:hypothetical protein